MSVSDALDAVVSQLTAAGLKATRDAGAFYPSPVACLVGMPTVARTGLAHRTLEVPVHVVSADPPSTKAVDTLYSAAELAAAALEAATYQPAEWAGGPNADSLPSITITATVSIAMTQEG